MALIDSVAAYWKFDEASGNAADSSPNGNTLTNNNSATFGAGKIGNCAILSAASLQFFSITDALQSNLRLGGSGNSWSIAGWVNPTSTPSGNWGLFEKYLDSDPGHGMFFGLGFSGGVGVTRQFGVSTDGTAGGNDVTPMSNGTWYHIAWTWDQINAKFVVYKNASPLETSNGFPYYVPQDTVHDVHVGLYQTSSTYADMSVDELGVWNRALSAAEVTMLYNGGAGLTYPFTSVDVENPLIPQLSIR